MFWPIDEIARRKLNQQDTWKCCRIERIGEDILCDGGIPYPSKNGLRWDRREIQKVIITKSDLDKARHDFETVSGNCWKCQGSGDIPDLTKLFMEHKRGRG